MKKKDILAAKDLILTSEEIVRKIAKEIDLSPCSIYSMVGQCQFEDGDFGYDDEEAHLVYEDFHYRHHKKGIHVLGVGSHRIVFSFQGKAMKVPLRGMNENDQEWHTWRFCKNKVDKDFLLPIVDSFTNGDIRILLFPIIDAMDSYDFNYYSSLFNEEDEIGYSELEEILKEIPRSHKENFLRYLLICQNISDNHEGNYGYYEGKLVSIDYAMYYSGVGKNRRLLNLLRKVKV